MIPKCPFVNQIAMALAQAFWKARYDTRILRVKSMSTQGKASYWFTTSETKIDQPRIEKKITIHNGQIQWLWTETNDLCNAFRLISHVLSIIVGQ